MRAGWAPRDHAGAGARARVEAAQECQRAHWKEHKGACKTLRLFNKLHEDLPLDIRPKNAKVCRGATVACTLQRRPGRPLPLSADDSWGACGSQIALVCLLVSTIRASLHCLQRHAPVAALARRGAQSQEFYVQRVNARALLTKLVGRPLLRHESRPILNEAKCSVCCRCAHRRCACPGGAPPPSAVCHTRRLSLPRSVACNSGSACLGKRRGAAAWTAPPAAPPAAPSNATKRTPLLPHAAGRATSCLPATRSSAAPRATGAGPVRPTTPPPTSRARTRRRARSTNACTRARSGSTGSSRTRVRRGHCVPFPLPAV